MPLVLVLECGLCPRQSPQCPCRPAVITLNIASTLAQHTNKVAASQRGARWQRLREAVSRRAQAIREGSLGTRVRTDLNGAGERVVRTVLGRAFQRVQRLCVHVRVCVCVCVCKKWRAYQRWGGGLRDGVPAPGGCPLYPKYDPSC